jgi:hypothetical protein
MKRVKIVKPKARCRKAYMAAGEKAALAFADKLGIDPIRSESWVDEFEFDMEDGRDARMGHKPVYLSESKPSAYVQRKKEIDQLRDWPVNKLSPHPQHVEIIDYYREHEHSPVWAIGFVTKRGTVLLTCEEGLLPDLYRRIHKDFGPGVVVPKKERTP